MAESLATGTPVVAYRRGAAPEIVTHGLTGFLCDDQRDAVAALCEIQRLDRRDCRQDAERRFGVDRMVREYVALYEEIIHTYSSRGFLHRVRAPRRDRDLMNGLDRPGAGSDSAETAS